MDIEKRYDDAVFFREIHHGFFDLGVDFLDFGSVFRVGVGGVVDEGGVEGGGEFVDVGGGAEFSFFEEVEGAIRGDLVDPGVEGGVAFEGGEGLVGFGEDFLEEVVSVFVLVGHGEDEAEEFVSILEDQGIEGTSIAVLGACHEVLIRVRVTRLTEHSGVWGVEAEYG